jgi:predicted oxidoreductase (fatty acid repression mutant protein)
MEDLAESLQDRWSPTAWDTTHVVTAADVERLVEAARWSPSAGNSQPWSFVTARRGDAVHQRLVPLLAASSRRWAPDAALLVVNICHRYVEGTDWDFSEFAEYDLGQSVAYMTLQGLTMDLSARQFRAFNREAVHQELELPSHWVAMTMTAIGRPAGRPPAEGRLRRSLAEVWWQPPLQTERTRSPS